MAQFVKTHGMSKTPTFNTWFHFRHRCINPKHKQYKDYGGRGITVCKRWNKFENFLADMGKKPEGMSIDRINNSKGYSLENCRWATGKEQAKNRRSNVIFNGEYATDASLRLGGSKRLVSSRIKYGWLTELAFTIPARGYSRSRP